MSWFAEALCQGDKREVLRAARRLEELAGRGGAGIENFNRTYVNAARETDWQPGVEVHRVFSRTAERLCEPAWRIGDAISRI